MQGAPAFFMSAAMRCGVVNFGCFLVVLRFLCPFLAEKGQNTSSFVLTGSYLGQDGVVQLSSATYILVSKSLFGLKGGKFAENPRLSPVYGFLIGCKEGVVRGRTTPSWHSY